MRQFVLVLLAATSLAALPASSRAQTLGGTLSLRYKLTNAASTVARLRYTYNLTGFIAGNNYSRLLIHQGAAVLYDELDLGTVETDFGAVGSQFFNVADPPSVANNLEISLLQGKIFGDPIYVRVWTEEFEHGAQNLPNWPGVQSLKLIVELPKAEVQGLTKIPTRENVPDHPEAAEPNISFRSTGNMQTIMPNVGDLSVSYPAGFFPAGVTVDVFQNDPSANSLIGTGLAAADGSVGVAFSRSLSGALLYSGYRDSATAGLIIDVTEPLGNPPLSAPTPFTAAYVSGATYLHWGATAAVDFSTFRLYRSPSGANFVPLATTTDTGYVDVGAAGSYYELTAADFSGSEGPASLVGPSQTANATPDAPTGMVLTGVMPNPIVGGRTSVQFGLPSSAPALLELIDIAGRRIESHSVGSMGSGIHRLEIAHDRHIPAGVYFIRLTQGRDVRVTRAVALN